MTTAIILVGHGSLRSASGASMIRIAALLRHRGVAEIVEPAFLNYSRPTLAEAAAKCLDAGASAVTVQPYFLVDGVYVRSDLRVLVGQAAAAYPALRFELTPVLGDHPALVDLARRRVETALHTAPDRGPTHLLLMAHGTPIAEANAPLRRVAEKLQAELSLDRASVAFLDCNDPTIPAAFVDSATSGAGRIVALPYFLHLGRHVSEDLPALVATARRTHVSVHIILAHHLDYDPCLADAVAGRAVAGRYIHPSIEGHELCELSA